jgi:ubiquinone/menaquinone biosynthesis C-methylase UbiE
MNDDLLNILKHNRDQLISENDPFTEERYDQMSLYLPVGKITVLDVGCGTGRGGGKIKKNRPDATIIGMDCVPERIEKLDKKIYQNNIVGFTENIKLEERSIDAIVAGEFLEHVPPKQIQDTLCEFFRILKLGGVFCMTTPHPRYLRNRIWNRSVLTDPAHVTQHYPEILKKRLMEIGFSNIAIRGSGKVSRYLGDSFPLSFYGSYLLKAVKW